VCSALKDTEELACALETEGRSAYKFDIGRLEDFYQRVYRHGANLVAVARDAGSTLATPSLHVSVARALSYVLHRARVAAERLGGMPVYLAGDGGLIVFPGWVPAGLLEGLEEYGRDGIEEDGEGFVGAMVRVLYRVAGVSGARAEKEEISPAGAFAVYLRRLFWGVDYAGEFVEGEGGFLPVYGSSGGAIFGVPAILSTGLSVGLRVSHYRDHMQGELAAARALVEAAKERGDALAVGYGRVSTLEPREALRSHVVLGFREGRELAEAPAAATLLAMAAFSGRVPISLLRRSGLAPGEVEAFEAEGARASLARYLIERHAPHRDYSSLVERLLGAGESTSRLLDAALMLYSAGR